MLEFGDEQRLPFLQFALFLRWLGHGELVATLSQLQVSRWLLTGAPVQTDFHIAAAEMRLPATVWFVLFVGVNGFAVWAAREPLLAVLDTVVTGVRGLVGS